MAAWKGGIQIRHNNLTFCMLNDTVFQCGQINKKMQNLVGAFGICHCIKLAKFNKRGISERLRWKPVIRMKN